MESKKNQFEEALVDIEGWGTGDNSESMVAITSEPDFREVESISQKKLITMSKTSLQRCIRANKSQLSQYRRTLSRQLRNYELPTAALEIHKCEEYIINVKAALEACSNIISPLEVLKRKKRKLEKLSLKYENLGERIKEDLSHRDPRSLMASLNLANKARLAEMYFSCAVASREEARFVAEEEIKPFMPKQKRL